MSEHAIRSLIRNIPDFPQEGIQFKDITPVLRDPQGLRHTIEWYRMVVEALDEVDAVAGIESRGFIIGAALARELNVGFIPIRKPGKLPYKTHQIEYQLEYGKDAVEMHVDAIRAGEKVAIVDDLLATGGTAKAAAQLVREAGGIVTCVACLIELDFLKGREQVRAVAGDNIESLIHY